MSRIGATTALADPELMAWDGEFWGQKIARASHPDVDEWAAANTVGLMWLLVPSDRPEEAQEAEERGWRFMDVRVTLSATPKPLSPWVQFAAADDVEPLVKIARTAHRITRFYADPSLPDERCDDLYEHWIRNSCAGWADAVFVTRIDDRITGYVTVHVDGDVGSIGLIAVAEESRRIGFGEQLVQGALDHAFRHNCRRMTVVTQGRNVAAQRLFQKCGFRTRSTDIWMHKRFDQ